MRVRVSFTVGVDDEFRRALSSYYGGSGMASREEIKRHYEVYGSSLGDDIMHEYRRGAQAIGDEAKGVSDG